MTEKTDRELLEAAARAAGIEYRPDSGYRATGVGATGMLQLVRWDPLTDDGDALRLFCTLPWMCIETSDVGVTVRERGNPDHAPRVYKMWTEWLDKHGSDAQAATRRAIVRAAAAMGEQ